LATPWKLVSAAVIVLVIAGTVIAARGLPWAAAWSALMAAQAGWVIAALAANIAMFPLWTSQWRLLVPPARRPAWGRMLEIVALTSLMQNLVPVVGGQASALGLLVFRGGLTRGAAVSVVALDQMLTGLTKLAALGGAALISPMPLWMRGGAWSLFGVMAALLALLMAMAYSTRPLHFLAGRRQGRLAGALAGLGAWTENLAALRGSGGVIWAGFAYAVAKKVCEILAALAVQYACGIDLGLDGAVLVVAALGLSTLIRAPGNLGVYEATVLVIYTSLGVPPALALAAAVLQHLVALAPRLGGGFVILLMRRPGLSLPR
jgi:uncharacterized membrane protein YbhN (UPF0104 family)